MTCGFCAAFLNSALITFSTLLFATHTALCSALPNFLSMHDRYHVQV
jgi:hypothetical protein